MRIVFFCSFLSQHVIYVTRLLLLFLKFCFCNRKCLVCEWIFVIVTRSHFLWQENVFLQQDFFLWQVISPFDRNNFLWQVMCSVNNLFLILHVTGNINFAFSQGQCAEILAKISWGLRISCHLGSHPVRGFWLVGKYMEEYRTSTLNVKYSKYIYFYIFLSCLTTQNLADIIIVINIYILS